MAEKQSKFPRLDDISGTSSGVTRSEIDGLLNTLKKKQKTRSSQILCSTNSLQQSTKDIEDFKKELDKLIEKYNEENVLLAVEKEKLLRDEESLIVLEKKLQNSCEEETKLEDVRNQLERLIRASSVDILWPTENKGLLPQILSSYLVSSLP